MGTTAEPTNLLTSLFGTTRSALLTLFFARPDEAFYLREVERRAGVGLGAVQRELQRLTTLGILRREARGRHVYYQAERACPVFAELHALVVKTAGLADVLRDALRPLANRIDVAFVFGSAAKGTMTSASDVDVLLVGEITFAEAVGALKPAQERLSRDVNPSVYSRDECRRKLSEGHHFLTNVWRDLKVLLMGGEDELTRLAEERLVDPARDESSGDRRPPRRHRA